MGRSVVRGRKRGSKAALPTLSYRRLLVLLSILIVSVVPATRWYKYTHPWPASDYKDYVELGDGLLVYHQFGHPEPTARRLPAFPAFLAVLLWLDWSLVWITIWNVALTASIGILVYFLTRSLTAGDERAAAMAGLLCAANPTFIFFSPIIASEHLFTPLFIGTLLLLHSEASRPRLRASLAGLMLGCAILTRGEALFYLPIAVFLLLRSVSYPRQRVMLSAYLLAACLVVVAPWYVRNLRVIGPGAGLSTVAGMNFYFAHNAHQYGFYAFEETPLQGLDELQANREGFRLGLEYLRENPLRLGANIAAGTKGLFSAEDVEIVRSALWVPASATSTGEPLRRNYPRGVLGVYKNYFIGLMALSLVLFLFLRRYPRDCWLVPVGVIVGSWACYAVVFWGKPRFRFTMEAFLCILAGIALSELSRLRWRRPPAGNRRDQEASPGRAAGRPGTRPTT